VFGPTAKALSPSWRWAVAFVTPPIIAYATDGKYYIARKPQRSCQDIEAIPVLHLRAPFEPEDIDFMPAYAGRSVAVLFARCALPRSLQAACAHPAQMAEALGKLLPKADLRQINSQLGHYLGVFARPPGSSP